MFLAVVHGRVKAHQSEDYKPKLHGEVRYVDHTLLPTMFLPCRVGGDLATGAGPPSLSPTREWGERREQQSRRGEGKAWGSFLWGTRSRGPPAWASFVKGHLLALVHVHVGVAKEALGDSFHVPGLLHGQGGHGHLQVFGHLRAQRHRGNVVAVLVT